MNPPYTQTGLVDLFDRSGGNLNLHIVCLFLFQSISSQPLFTFHFILDPSLFKLLHINSNFFMCNVIKNSKQLKVKKFRMYTYQLVTFTFKNNSNSNKNLLLLMCSNLCILAASINNNNIHRRNQLNSLKSLYSSFSKNLKFYLLYKCGFCHRPDQTEQWSRGQEHRGSGIHNSRELVIRFVCKLSIKWRICMKHIWVFRKET